MGLATGTNQKVLFLSQNRPLWPLRTSAILLKSWERDLKCQVIIWRSNCQVIIWRMRSSCLNILWYPVPPSCNTDPPPQMLYIVTAIPHLFQGCRFPLTHTPPVGVAVAQLYEHLCHSLQTPKIQVVVRKPPGQCNMHPGRASCCCTQPGLPGPGCLPHPEEDALPSLGSGHVLVGWLLPVPNEVQTAALKSLKTVIYFQVSFILLKADTFVSKNLLSPVYFLRLNSGYHLQQDHCPGRCPLWQAYCWRHTRALPHTPMSKVHADTPWMHFCTFPR